MKGCSSRMNLPLLLSIVPVLILCQHFPIDNALEGDPEVECGAASIAITFNTRNPFEGNVFVRGMRDRPECSRTDRGRQVAGIDVSFDSCNVARTRSLNPRGVFVSSTIVISFHPIFVTKVDRAFRVECFYMESDQTVTAEVGVSEFTTSLITAQVPLPVCRYEILDGGPTGQPIHFAALGQPVYHKWWCQSDATDTFCMAIHSCSVDDGAGQRVEFLDGEGCAIDSNLLPNLDYPEDLVAGQLSQVFKYADKEHLFYECQITINIKEPGSDCPRAVCMDGTGFATAIVAEASNRKEMNTSSSPSSSTTSPLPFPSTTSPYQRIFRRSAALFLPLAAQTLDVRAELTAIDNLFNKTLVKTERLDVAVRGREWLSEAVPGLLCVSPAVLALSALVSSIAILACSSSLIWITFRRSSSKKSSNSLF